MINWQARYESGDVPWDRGGPAPGLVQFLTGRQVSGRVLVPGCGQGHDLAPLAEGGAEEVVGFDIAPSAVAQARERCAALPNVRIEQGDIFDLLPGKWAQSADWIWEHTCYCAIPPDRREDYARATHAALKPGGRLLAVFYLNPWEAGEDQNQGPPFGTTVEALDAIFAPMFELEQSWQPEVAYAGREGRELMRILRRKTQA